MAGRENKWDIRFTFVIEFNNIQSASFRKAAGLTWSTKTEEIQVGGLNDYKVKLLGPSTYKPLTLEKGFVSTNSEFYKWMLSTHDPSSTVDREIVKVVVKDAKGEDQGSYNLYDAWISKYEGPEFNAKQSELAIEKLEIAYSYFEFLLPGQQPAPQPDPPPPPPPPPVLEGVNFGFDSAKITPDPNPALDQWVAYLDQAKDKNILVEGHTCDKGSASYNKTLSGKRAKSVKDYMISKGTSASRISSTGCGEEKPMVPNTDEASRSKNRRCEIHEV